MPTFFVLFRDPKSKLFLCDPCLLNVISGINLWFSLFLFLLLSHCYMRNYVNENICNMRHLILFSFWKVANITLFYLLTPPLPSIYYSLYVGIQNGDICLKSLRRVRQEHHEVQVSLCYIVRPSLERIETR